MKVVMLKVNEPNLIKSYIKIRLTLIKLKVNFLKSIIHTKLESRNF